MAELQEQIAFDSPIFSLWNKNCLFKLDNSIKSLSTTKTFWFNSFSLFSTAPTPNKDKFLIISQPNAPAPAIKTFVFLIWFINSFPKIEIWSEYLLFSLLTFPSFLVVGKKFRKLNIFHWSIGKYFPVAFIISWETIPPRNEVIHGISVLANFEIFIGIFS